MKPYALAGATLLAVLVLMALRAASAEYERQRASLTPPRVPRSVYMLDFDEAMTWSA